MALMEGIQLCQQQGLDHVMVELDSQVLVRMLNNEVATPWKLRTMIEKIQLQIRNGSFLLFHVFREVNAATLASSTHLNWTFSSNELPKEVLRLVVLGRKHTPYVRLVKITLYFVRQ